MCDVSSARPARLRHFRTTADAIADGLVRRVSASESAKDAYVGGNEYTYRVDAGPLLDAASALADTLRSLGVWVGDVGDAFAAVDGDDLDDTHSLADDTLIANLPPEQRDDPFREGEGVTPSLDDWEPVPGVEPPPWLDPLRGTDTVLDWTEPALAAAVGHYLQRVSGYTRATGTEVAGYVRYDPRFGGRAILGRFATAADLDRFGRWVGRGAVGISFAAGAAEQWFSDEGLDTGERIGRAAWMGGWTAAGSGLGGWGGAAIGGAACAAGGVTAPAAPVCALAGGIIGGIGGGAAFSWVADQMPWMDDPDPAERDHDDLADGIASFDLEPVQEMAPLVAEAARTASEDNQALIDGLLLDPTLRHEHYPDAPAPAPLEPLTDEEIEEILAWAEPHP
ncbi:MAG: hypothetical protein ACRD0U_04530 [Acidimicrobiales bacterium]